MRIRNSRQTSGHTSGYSNIVVFLGVLVCLTLMPSATSSAQSPGLSGVGRTTVLAANPRELSIDIFTQLKRDTDPEAIAARLGLLIPAYRFSCPRVTDYQIFSAMNNIFVLKVKCSGLPFYGVTVAANGYVAVYGGDGIIQPFDRREGLVLSFGVDGAVIRTSEKTTKEAIKEAIAEISQEGDGFNPAYLSAMLIGLFVIVGGGAFAWITAMKRRASVYHRNPKLKVKRPLERVEIAAGVAMSSDLKNQLQGESEIVSRHVYRHPAGFYIARGKKGRRRIFTGSFGAVLYARFGIKLFEMDASDTEKLLLAWVDGPAQSGT